MKPSWCLLLWDVDHTLIENAGVSKEIYLKAFQILTGETATFPPRTDGRTDMAIMEDLLAANNSDTAQFGWQQQYEALRLAGQLKKTDLARRGHALPGAKETLRQVSTRLQGTIQGPLTGNIEENARVKLGAFGMEQLLDFEVGAFGSESRRRSDLVGVAQKKAATKMAFDPGSDSTVLIGDTPLDVEAGLTKGAHVLAVATGPASVNELLAAGADVALRDLTEWEAFGESVEELHRRGPIGPRQPPGV